MNPLGMVEALIGAMNHSAVLVRYHEAATPHETDCRVELAPHRACSCTLHFARQSSAMASAIRAFVCACVCVGVRLIVALDVPPPNNIIIPHACVISRFFGRLVVRATNKAGGRPEIVNFTSELRSVMHALMVSGKGTRDLCGPSGLTTEQFVDAVADALHTRITPVITEPVCMRCAHLAWCSCSERRFMSLSTIYFQHALRCSIRPRTDRGAHCICCAKRSEAVLQTHQASRLC